MRLQIDIRPRRCGVLLETDRVVDRVVALVVLVMVALALRALGLPLDLGTLAETVS